VCRSINRAGALRPIRGRQVHVPLRGRQVLMTRQFLNLSRWSAKHG